MNEYSAKNWIDGAFVTASTRSDSINPATYQSIGEYPDEGGAAARAAIQAARRAFRETAWAHDAELRARVLEQMAAAIERGRDLLIEILSLENGKVRGEAGFEVDGAPSKLRYWAAMARTASGRAALPKPGSLSIILRQPMGVAGVIVPWNRRLTGTNRARVAQCIHPRDIASRFSTRRSINARTLEGLCARDGE